MKLTELEPQLLRYGQEEVTEDDGSKWTRDVYHHVDRVDEADGICFVCPGCLVKMGSRPGVHSLICWSRKVPDYVSPGPGRWALKGTGLHDLTLDGDPAGSARSVQAGCWHGFITNGEVTNA